MLARAGVVMPAAELSRLRAQLTQLSALFDRPALFCRALVELCAEYTDPSFRSGQSSGGPALLPSYRLTPLVMRQLELALIAVCRAQPQHALPVADALWAQSYYEPRFFAILLLGLIPLSQAEGILERLRKWAAPNEDRLILEILLTRGAQRLRAEGPDALLDLYEEWINAAEPARRVLGLKGFASLVADPDYENLPPLFDRLFPLVRAAPQSLYNELSLLLTALAQRTPTETAYFLRQVLASPTSRETPRLARRVFPYLSPAQQDVLKSALKNRG